MTDYNFTDIENIPVEDFKKGVNKLLRIKFPDAKTINFRSCKVNSNTDEKDNDDIELNIEY